MRVPPPGDATDALRERLSSPQSREARYYAAVHSDTVMRGARAAMALADEELAEMRAKVARVKGMHQPHVCDDPENCGCEGRPVCYCSVDWPCDTATALSGTP